MIYDFIIPLVAFAFVSSITPGPNNLMLLASAANYGFKRSLPQKLGISLRACVYGVPGGYRIGRAL